MSENPDLLKAKIRDYGRPWLADYIVKVVGATPGYLGRVLIVMGSCEMRATEAETLLSECGYVPAKE